MKAEQFRNAEGQLTISKIVVYSESTALVVGAMVLIGESALLAPTVDAEEVRGLSAVPGDTDLKKAWL